MNEPRPTRIRSTVPWWYAALFVFLAVTCLRVWTGDGSLHADARAQIPDAGLQRHELVAEMRRTNQLLTDIKALLESGKLHVRVESADNQPD